MPAALEQSGYPLRQVARVSPAAFAGVASDGRRLDMALKSRLQPTTARFWNAEHQRYFEALLDFVMVSPGLAARMPRWRIWHPLNDPKCWAVPELRDALLTASDHFPVTLDLAL